MKNRRDSDISRGVGDPEVSERAVRRALFTAAALVSIALGVTFAGFQWRSERLLEEQLLSQSRAFASEVVATRRFVGEMGGIWVRESREVTANPFLASIPGLRTRIEDTSGARFLMMNPAAVTRELSDRLAGEASPVRFRLIGRHPINPANAPTAFEADALRRVSGEESEVSVWEHGGDKPRFRYFHPLVISSECLGCHSYQGYGVGDVGGAIAVELDAAPVLRRIREGRVIAVVALVGSVSTLLVLLHFVMTRLVDRLLLVEQRLRSLASTDELTGLANRRVGLRRLAEELVRARRTGQPLACIMFDLDRFKNVNDTLGHAVGDSVLRAVADAFRCGARTYDVVARLGGEEFLVLLPQTAASEAVSIVERMRATVSAACTRVLPDDTSPVTVSAGLAVAEPPAYPDAEGLLKRSDDALYAAKRAGRDRMATA